MSNIVNYLSPAGEKEICRFKPSAFDMFLKILDIIKCTEFEIRNSHLTKFISPSALIDVDFTNIIGTNVSFGFEIRPETSKLMRNIDGNDPVIISEADKYRYRINADDLNMPLYKCSTGLSDVKLPSMIEIIPDVHIKNVDKLKSVVGRSKCADIQIYDDEFVSIIGQNEATFHFEPKAKYEYAGRVPDMAFRSYSMMRIFGKNMALSLKKDDKGYWLCICRELSRAHKVFLYERLADN